jgi:hypothetical protein
VDVITPHQNLGCAQAILMSVISQHVTTIIPIPLMVFAKIMPANVKNQCAKTRRMILGFAQGTCLLASILDASKNPLRKLSFARCISVSAQSHSVMTWLLEVLFVSHIASTA